MESPKKRNSYYGFDTPPEEKKKERESKKTTHTESDSVPPKHEGVAETRAPEPRPEHHEMEEDNGAFASINEQIRARREFVGTPEDMPIEFKKEIRRALFDRKYELQEANATHIKTLRDMGEALPLRRNWNWDKKAKVSYVVAWTNLRTWAQAEQIWDDTDEREYAKETGRAATLALHETLHKKHHPFITAILGKIAEGAGYAFMSPGIGFRESMKFLLPFFIEDRATTQKMFEQMFGKQQEKEKRREEKKGPDRAKEHETILKLKKTEIDILKTLKDGIIDQKIRHSMSTEEYNALPPEERERLKQTIGKKEYHNTWRLLRMHWIQEGAWNVDDEQTFREAIENDLKSRDLLTPAELDALRKAERDRDTQQQKVDKNPENAQFQAKLDDAKARVEEIETKKQMRIEQKRWPDYTRGKKKGGTSIESFVTGYDEEDEDDDT